LFKGIDDLFSPFFFFSILRIFGAVQQGAVDTLNFCKGYKSGGTRLPVGRIDMFGGVADAAELFAILLNQVSRSHAPAQVVIRLNVIPKLC
jgi:hypothetical protein